MVAKPKINSRVITFYSYKGGVGRSMAMANVGVLLAMWGYKVLLVDWDLEAPGLENYFEDHLDIKQSKEKKGLIDLLQLKAQCDEILVDEIPWEQYVQTINNKNFSIDLITAGKRDEGYFNRVRQFDYAGFYNESNGGEYLENLREYWLDHYDCILIDSRTGLTDSSGICSIHMPDILVLLFTPNEQSFSGIKEVARKAIDGQKQVIYDRFRLRVLPIPSRIENAETQLLDEWMHRIYTESAAMLEWLPKRESDTSEYSVSPEQVISQLKIPYKTFYAYGERLPVTERGTIDPQDLGYVYENIAAVLINDLQNIHLLSQARDLLIKKAKGEEIVDYSDLERKYAEEQDAKQKLEDELREKESIIQQKQLQQKSRKNNIIWIGLLVAALIAALFYFIGRNKDPRQEVKLKEINEPAIATGDEQNKAVDFARIYSTSNQQAELGFNLTMAEKYQQLEPAYRDSFADIKEKIEFAISYRFQEIADSFYLALQTNPALLQSVSADTIFQFGRIRKTASKNIINRIATISKSSRITNAPVDSSFDLQLHPSGFSVKYRVNGNTLLDINGSYKKITVVDELLFDRNLKINHYSYRIVDTIPAEKAIAQTNVNLFICSAVSKMDYSKFNSIAGKLKAANMNVSSKVNFSGSKDPASPLYFSESQIRYSEKSLHTQALNVQAIIQKSTGYLIPIQLRGSGQKNYINVYLCSAVNNINLDTRQQNLRIKNAKN